MLLLAAAKINDTDEQSPYLEPLPKLLLEPQDEKTMLTKLRSGELADPHDFSFEFLWIEVRHLAHNAQIRFFNDHFRLTPRTAA